MISFNSNIKQSGLFANVNKKLIEFDQDHLHHLTIDKCNDTAEDLKRMFGDVRVRERERESSIYNLI